MNARTLSDVAFATGSYGDGRRHDGQSACTSRAKAYDSGVAMNRLMPRRSPRRSLILAAIAAALLLAPTLLLGQVRERPESIVVKTKRIERILGHRLGYQVFYLKGNQRLGSFYAPNSWFNQSGGGEMIFGDRPEYPYFRVVYVDGEIDLVRLFVRRGRGHLTWGRLRGDDAEIEPLFNIDTPNIEF